MNTTRSAPPIADDVAVAVLAAGSGSRFGGGKLDAMLGGKPVGRWVTDAVEAAGARKRFLVCSPTPPEFAAGLQGWTLVRNDHADRGIGTSLHAAAEAAAGSARLVIALADMPLVPASHLSALAQRDGVVFTRYPNGKPGVPAAFPRSAFARLLSLPPGKGAAAVAWDGDPAMLDCDPAFLSDVDRPDDLKRIAGRQRS